MSVNLLVFKLCRAVSDESNNDKEYFAECFLLFINGPILLKKINVSAYYLFEKLINNIDAIVELI